MNGVRREKRVKCVSSVARGFPFNLSLELRVSAHTQFPIANVMLAEFVTHAHTLYTHTHAPLHGSCIVLTTTHQLYLQEKQRDRTHVLIFHIKVGKVDAMTGNI